MANVSKISLNNTVYDIKDTVARGASERNEQAIEQNAQAIEQNAQAIEQNAQAIEQNAQAIEQNAQAIEQNAQAIELDAVYYRLNSPGENVDCSTLLSNAINTVQNSPRYRGIYLPDSSYYLETTIALPRNCVIVGAHGTITSNAQITIDGSYVQIAGLDFIFMLSDTTKSGIVNNTGHDVKFTDCRFTLPANQSCDALVQCNSTPEYSYGWRFIGCEFFSSGSCNALLRYPAFVNYCGFNHYRGSLTDIDYPEFDNAPVTPIVLNSTFWHAHVANSGSCITVRNPNDAKIKVSNCDFRVGNPSDTTDGSQIIRYRNTSGTYYASVISNCAITYYGGNYLFEFYYANTDISFVGCRIYSRTSKDFSAVNMTTGGITVTGCVTQNVNLTVPTANQSGNITL